MSALPIGLIVAIGTLTVHLVGLSAAEASVNYCTSQYKAPRFVRVTRSNNKENTYRKYNYRKGHPKRKLITIPRNEKSAYRVYRNPRGPERGNYLLIKGECTKVLLGSELISERSRKGRKIARAIKSGKLKLIDAKSKKVVKKKSATVLKGKKKIDDIKTYLQATEERKDPLTKQQRDFYTSNLNQGCDSFLRPSGDGDKSVINKIKKEFKKNKKMKFKVALASVKEPSIFISEQCLSGGACASNCSSGGVSKKINGCLSVTSRDIDLYKGFSDEMREISKAKKASGLSNSEKEKELKRINQFYSERGTFQKRKNKIYGLKKKLGEEYWKKEKSLGKRGSREGEKKFVQARIKEQLDEWVKTTKAREKLDGNEENQRIKEYAKAEKEIEKIKQKLKKMKEEESLADMSLAIAKQEQNKRVSERWGTSSGESPSVKKTRKNVKKLKMKIVSLKQKLGKIEAKKQSFSLDSKNNKIKAKLREIANKKVKVDTSSPTQVCAHSENDLEGYMIPMKWIKKEDESRLASMEKQIKGERNGQRSIIFKRGASTWDSN